LNNGIDGYEAGGSINSRPYTCEIFLFKKGGCYMKKIMLTFCFMLCFSIMAIFSAMGCNNTNGNTMHRITWSAPGGIDVTATVNGLNFNSGDNIEDGADLRLEWDGVAAAHRVQIMRGNAVLNSQLGSGYWILENIDGSRSLVFRITAPCIGCGEFNDCICCDECNAYPCECVDCDVCNDLSGDEHCPGCCPLDCPVCPVRVSVHIERIHTTATLTWFLEDEDGNRLTMQSVNENNFELSFFVGDSFRLRWTYGALSLELTLTIIIGGQVINSGWGLLSTRNWYFDIDIAAVEDIMIVFLIEPPDW